MKHYDEIARLLHEHPIFHFVDEPTRHKLLRQETIVFLDTNELLYKSGQYARQLFVLLNGGLQIEFPETPRAVRGLAVALQAGPCIIGENQLVHHKRWPGTGVALVPLKVLAISLETLRTLMTSQADFAWAVYRDLTYRFMSTLEQSRIDRASQPAQLVARYVLSYQKMFEQLGRASLRVELSQQELARAVGLRRETVNRVLKSWAANRWVELQSSSVEVRAQKKLRDLLPEGDEALLTRIPLEPEKFPTITTAESANERVRPWEPSGIHSPRF